MSLRILGGMAKGFTLAVPSESVTRPTSVLLKRRLFDYYQSFSGYYFIDLCAGSGSIGLEALSRNADAVLLVEKNFQAYKVLKENIKNFETRYPNLDLNSKQVDISKFLKDFKDYYLDLDQEEKSRVMIFFDPPYEKIDLYDLIFNSLSKISFSGVLITEACRQKTMSEEDFSNAYGIPTRIYKQGTSFLYVYDYNK